jgi:hypothetical protein
MYDTKWRASHSCIDAAHKFLMLLDIHSSHLLLPTPGVGRFSESNEIFDRWLRTIDHFESFDLTHEFHNVKRTRRKLLIRFGEVAEWWNQLRNVFTSTEVIELRVDDTTIVFIGRVFHTNTLSVTRTTKKIARSDRDITRSTTVYSLTSFVIGASA